FRSIQENIDTSTSNGKLIFHIFDTLAEFERDIIRDRTTAGLVANRKRGKFGATRGGFSKVCYNCAIYLSTNAHFCPLFFYDINYLKLFIEYEISKIYDQAISQKKATTMSALTEKHSNNVVNLGTKGTLINAPLSTYMSS
ncbi:MAG: recombinase family protein, partial [Candidatus Marinimicrobia bacterium]|nr:recombinase family protein [Candidatus Neomarinimicrobiota bacterium]